MRAIPADHDVTSREAALRFTDEGEHLTTGVLYEVARPSLLDELAEIERRARREAPSRDAILRAFQLSAA
jgi:hypothetical protein